MSKDTYLELCQQRGDEPNPDRMPPGMEDFPEIIQQAISVFNVLGDRISADIGYLGKDYSLLPVYLEDVEDKELFLEVLAWLDGKVIKKSQEEMKRARDKIKSKTGK